MCKYVYYLGCWFDSSLLFSVFSDNRTESCQGFWALRLLSVCCLHYFIFYQLAYIYVQNKSFKRITFWQQSITRLVRRNDLGPSSAAKLLSVSKLQLRNSRASMFGQWLNIVVMLASLILKQLVNASSLTFLQFLTSLARLLFDMEKLYVYIVNATLWYLKWITFQQIRKKYSYEIFYMRFKLVIFEQFSVTTWRNCWAWPFEVRLPSERLRWVIWLHFLIRLVISSTFFTFKQIKLHVVLSFHWKFKWVYDQFNC